SWELVGICSYLLIGFYYERMSASNAANKAFITNRVGDAGFIIGMLILWSYLGTFNFEGIFSRLRSPDSDSHSKLEDAGQIVRAAPVAPPGDKEERAEYENKLKRGIVPVRILNRDEPTTMQTLAILFPRDASGHFHGVGPGGD